MKQKLIDLLYREFKDYNYTHFEALEMANNIANCIPEKRYEKKLGLVRCLGDVNNSIVIAMREIRYSKD